MDGLGPNSTRRRQAARAAHCWLTESEYAMFCRMITAGEPMSIHASLIAKEMTGAIARDLESLPGGGASGEVLLLVNGFGATPAIELYLMYGSARRQLEKAGLRIARSLVGNYVTSLDMAGCSVTVAMLDRETVDLWDRPVRTAALRW